MTALVQINQGTAPAGTDGDTVRAAFAKVNSNTVTLANQVPLVMVYLPDSNAVLDSTYVGKRVAANMSVAGRTVAMPKASTVALDQCILLWNVGQPFTVVFQPGDSAQVNLLNSGDWLLYVSDGNSYYQVVQRGRNLWDEVVGGSLSVGGTLSVAYPITATSTINANNGIVASGSISVNRSAGEGDLQLGQNDGYFYGNTQQVGWYSPTKGQISYTFANTTFTVPNLQVVSAATFNQRPVFAGATPWDSANLVGPMTLAGAQTVAGAKTFTAATVFAGYGNFSATSGGTYVTSPINVSSAALAGIGFNSGGIGGVWRLDGPSGNFQSLNYNAASWTGITCSAVTQASDAALKTNVSELSNVLDKLRGKRTVFYSLKSDPDTKHIGVISQEWQDDFPELVVDTGVDIDEDGDFIAHQYDDKGVEIFGPKGKPESRRALGFNYSNASAVALQAAIELQDRLDAALARIEALEAKQP